MTFEAKVVADSISAENGIRISTLQLKYPRFIHAEFMTHRMFSRNASSSRAIPVEKLVGQAIGDPAFFLHVGSNKPGMQAGDEIDVGTRLNFRDEWNELLKTAAGYVLKWSAKYHIHKQVANRAIEPWSHITVLVTSTEWENFFQLRCHKDAQPEMQFLAELMRVALEQSIPEVLRFGEWHLPFVHEREGTRYAEGTLRAISTARCARVSYLNHDGTEPNVDADLKLYDRLMAGVPKHASPSEHQATPLVYGATHCSGLGLPIDFCPGVTHMDRRGMFWSGNFRGWVQNRQLLEHPT